MVAASSSTYAYLGEFHTDKHRSVSITCASIFIAIAIIALPGKCYISFFFCICLPNETTLKH